MTYALGLVLKFLMLVLPGLLMGLRLLLDVLMVVLLGLLRVCSPGGTVIGSVDGSIAGTANEILL